MTRSSAMAVRISSTDISATTCSLAGGGVTDTLKKKKKKKNPRFVRRRYALEGGAGADVIEGGGRLDTASYATSNAGVKVNLETGLAAGGHAQGDVLSVN